MNESVALGGHPVALRPEADLNPEGVARIVADFMEVLDLPGVTLVGNDTGGAICQIVIANHPGRIGRLVLTNCDAYGAFFPLLLMPFHYAARFLGTRFTDLLAWSLRARPVQRVLLWTVARRRLDDAVLDSYFAPLINDAEVRGNLTRFLAQVFNHHTLEAARVFPSFRRPVLIVWGEDDRSTGAPGKAPRDLPPDAGRRHPLIGHGRIWTGTATEARI
jgi:pimeloyl-ACP methyl ester carboxylesterase